MSIPITVAYGDGIGPEIMDSVLSILKEAGAKISIETIEVGEKLYKRNYTSGIAGDTWESLKRTRVLLKAPITTPLGGGYKSLNVTLRKALRLFANVRPAVAYYPFIDTKHPNINLVIVRENQEDLYSGIEYRQTRNVYQSLKLISRLGSERIIRYAFDYARVNGFKKVSCFSKDNIMKFSDGIFHKVFEEVKKDYSDLSSDHYIVDIGTARIADTPEKFEVIVTSNLYGDIISDVAAQISGSVGLAGSSNIGKDYAMFEAVHGSAPDIASKDIANPSGLINAAVMMLAHIGEFESANVIENALKVTIESGIHTQDIFNEKNSSSKVGTKDFTKALIKNLGSKPKVLKEALYSKREVKQNIEFNIDWSIQKRLVGVDIFIDANVKSAHELASKISSKKLSTISTEGLLLWPREEEFEIVSDHWCCRFLDENMTHKDIIDILSSLSEFDVIKTENLYMFGDVRGYSLAQGE